MTGNYNFNYNDMDWEEIKNAFPIESVLRDYMGVTMHGTKCACPVHGGKHLNMSIKDNGARCFSKCQHTYSAIELVKFQDNLVSTYDAILHLCDFYGIDPTTFQGVTERDALPVIEKPKKTISLTKNQMFLLGLSVNPFRRRTVTTTYGTKDVKLSSGKIIQKAVVKAYKLSDEECSYLVMKSVLNFNKRANFIIHNLNQYMYACGFGDNSFIPAVKPSLMWINNIKDQIKTIGTSKPEYITEAMDQYFEKTPDFFKGDPKFRFSNNTFTAKDYERCDYIDDVDLLAGIDDVKLYDFQEFLTRHGIERNLPKIINENYEENDGARFACLDRNTYLFNTRENLMDWGDFCSWVVDACECLKSFADDHKNYSTPGDFMTYDILLDVETIAKGELDITDAFIKNINTIFEQDRESSLELTDIEMDRE